MYDNKGSFQGRATSIRRLMSYKEIEALGLRGLNYNEQAVDIITRASQANSGIVFVTGKTNSGKTTLLSCILSDIHKSNQRIKSIESPVEIVAPYSQVDLTRTETADERYRMTGDIAISALLRQDPDVVLIQEVRKKEEVDQFVELGLKGHLAFTTMHTGSVEETILRAMKSIDDEQTLKTTLNLIVSQSLVRKKCPKCDGKKTVDGNKCSTCDGLGVKGVLPVYEIAYMGETDNYKYNLKDIKSAIKEGLVEYISKHQIAKDYYENNLIFKEDYDKILKFEDDLQK